MRACGEEMEIVKKRAQASIVKGVMRLGNEYGLCRVTEGPQGEFALVRAPSSCSSTVAFGLSAHSTFTPLLHQRHHVQRAERYRRWIAFRSRSCEGKIRAKTIYYRL